MNLFLDAPQRQALLEARRQGNPTVHRFWTALMARAARRAASLGLLTEDDDATWWYPAAEYLSDAAMACALEPAPNLKAWLRDAALAVARRPVADWIGPWYRDHTAQPPLGHLETAHLCWGLAAALDLAPEAFTQPERDELHEALQDKGIALCRQWLANNTHLANWRAVMVAGVATAAAAVGDRESLAFAAAETFVCGEAFQPDGSYAESLQYANYLAYALMMAHEAIRGAAPDLDALSPDVCAKAMPWFAASMLYARPLAGWGPEPRSRAVNFNDCGALFRPSGDLLLHIAARCRETCPTEAGLARWLFETYYAPVPAQRPHNLATFGLRNDWGFLTLPFLPQTAPALSPAEAGLPTAAGFSNGNVIVRNAWPGETVLAVQGGTGPLHGPGHLHGDLNSFLLVHRNERLLVDPGHSCYRNLIHGLESSSATHNTCTFLVEQDALGLQEDLSKARLIEQSNTAARRRISGGRVSEPVAPRGRRLLLEQAGEVTVIGSEAGMLYGPPIGQFARFWIQAGDHALFIVDRIRAARPVTTVWNWLLNHRDDATTIDVANPHTILMRRRLAGLKLFHLAGGRLNGPIYAYVHDAYHPEPDRLGEGRPGSGWLYRWIEPAAEEFRLGVHAFALDDAALIDRWEAAANDDVYSLACGEVRWTLSAHSAEPLLLRLHSEDTGRTWQIAERDGGWRLNTEH
ncbi:MAG: heparinase II/III family protein [Thermoguttaceae bacterium]|jgi:hypothetical protein|nr:heparinase II/III family protein [Thermoguttaceae bacterium]